MTQMRASVLHSGGVVKCEMIDKPKCNDDEVLVKVAYAGVCGSDLPRSMEENAARLYPLVLGHEFCGTIAELGRNVTDINVGDNVVVAPLIPDPNSEYTKEGIFGLSDNYTIIGTGRNGGFAEYVAVPRQHVVKIPSSIDLKNAAGIEPATISFHALQRVGVNVGDTVVVLGCGSIGQFAVQCAKIFGAKKIIAVDIADSKLELIKSMGADVGINSRTEDLYARIKEETPHGLGADVVVETAGTKFTQEQSLMVARKRGRIVFVGISHADLPLSEAASQRILRSELMITGSWNSYSAPYPGRAWDAVIAFMEKGQIDFLPMISHLIELEDLGQYLYDMYHRKFDINKVVVKVAP